MRVSFPLLMLLIFPTERAVASTVVELSNGDRITGTLKKLSQDALLVSTEYAGDISIDWDQVRQFSTEDSFQARLASGERLEGRVRLEPPGEVVVEGLRETRRVPRSDLVSFVPPPSPEDYRLWENWHGSFKLGLNISRGNTDLSTLSFVADPTRRTAKDRIGVRLNSLRSRQEGRRLGDIYRLSGRYDRFFAERRFFFVQGRVERDEQASVDYRIRQGGGLGYDLISSEDTQFAFTGGLSLSQERLFNRDVATETEATLGVEFATTTLGPLALTSRAQFTPVLSEDRYFVEWVSGVSMPLFRNLSFGVEFLESYDSSPAEDSRKNDLQLLSTLGWTF